MALDATIEHELIERSRGGDDQSFDNLVEATKRSTYALAYRWTRDRDLSFDMVQEAYIKLFRFLPRWNHSCRIQTWLYRVVTNACIDRRRRSRFEAVPLHGADGDPGPEHFLAADTPSAVESFERQEAAESVRDCLAKLPTRMREAVHLRYLCGLSLREVAEVQSCSVGTIKATIHQALHKMRGQMQAVG